MDAARREADKFIHIRECELNIKNADIRLFHAETERDRIEKEIMTIDKKMDSRINNMSNRLWAVIILLVFNFGGIIGILLRKQ